MQGNLGGCSFFIGRMYGLSFWHKIGGTCGRDMLPHIIIGFGGSRIVIEGYAGGYHIDKRKTLMKNGCFQKGYHLGFVAAEALGHKGSTQFYRKAAKVYGLKGIDG